MQIQTLEEKTGLDRATIRFYEKEGLISPNRLQNGYRDYTDAHYMDLLRIKLLRQTGLSLDTIKQLINGRVALSSVLSDQLDIIDRCEEELIYARVLCNMMLQDNVTYHSIDPFRYFNAQERLATDNSQNVAKHYEEIYYTETHPFRRYIARYLDQVLLSSILMLIIIVVARVRPFTDIHNSLVSAISILLCIPLNALCIWMFGTTPGKFATGIFVRDVDGKNLTFYTAIKREWKVFSYGCGFYIPIYSWICLIRSYRTHSKGQELCWDYESDIQYEPWSAKRTTSVVLLIVICLTSISYSAFDLQKPRFRTDLLTIDQYAANYNDYAAQNEMHNFLSPEGEWYSNDIPGTVIIDSDPFIENWNFTTNQAGYLTEIEYELQTDSSFYVLDQREISLAIYTAVMAKPDAKVSNANAAVNDLSKIEYAIASGISEGEFEHCDVSVKWKYYQFKNGEHRYRILFNIVL